MASSALCPRLILVAAEVSRRQTSPGPTSAATRPRQRFALEIRALQNINLLKPPRGKLYPYNDSIAIYKCPADKFMVTIGGKKYPRTRSISMNGCMNGNSWHTALIDRQWWTYRKMSDIQTPSTQFVFIDEREESIDDGYFLVLVDRPPEWGNLPALYHNQASGLSFADGHAEIKKWQDPVSGLLFFPSSPMPPLFMPLRRNC
jgi:prepilin-type processing-associated H-X9-DG protein